MKIEKKIISNKYVKLVKPIELISSFPKEKKILRNILHVRKKIKNILKGKDSHLLVIIGPCSIHDIDATLEYAKKLKILRDAYKKRLEIIMRTYFEKPRTTIGWKGLTIDPYLDESFQINNGIKTARKLLIQINSLGLPTATEFLEIMTHRYISDLISWGSIGARTTESQIHRAMASSFSFPIGFKNSTDGNVQIAINAIKSSQNSHLFISQNNNGKLIAYKTRGNPYGHVIMRGGSIPNYQEIYIQDVCRKLRKEGLPEYLLVDCNHGNSYRKFRCQFDAIDSICQQLKKGSRNIVGVMIESNLIEGNQKLDTKKPLIYGKSITDFCIGWEESKKAIAMLNDSIECRFHS